MADPATQPDALVQVQSNTINTQIESAKSSRASSPQLTDALEAMLGAASPTLTRPDEPNHDAKEPEMQMNDTNNEVEMISQPNVTSAQPEHSLPAANQQTQSLASISNTDLPAEIENPASKEGETPDTRLESDLEHNADSHIAENVGTAFSVIGEPDSRLAEPIPDTKMQDTDKATEPVELPSGRFYNPESAATQGGDEEDYVIRPDQIGSDDEGQPEWEVDSNPYNSAEDKSSDDDDEDPDTMSVDKNFSLLSPKTQARQLMEAVADKESSDAENSSDDSTSSSESSDSDDDDELLGGLSGGESSDNGPMRSGQRLKTKNEVTEEIVTKPEVEITADMAITSLGHVHQIVEDTIIVKGARSGTEQTIDLGSTLCLGDRTFVGTIAEVIGEVRQPYYSVLFKNAEAIAAADIKRGLEIFFVNQLSKHVFTTTLWVKGSDASNFYDEEVDEHEMQFSDDEKEAEHKRKLKQAKARRQQGGEGVQIPQEQHEDKGGRGGRRGQNRGRGDRQDRRGRGGRSRPYDRAPYPPPQQVSTLNYDDDDGPYRPLTRPASLANPVGIQEAPLEHENFHKRGAPGNRGGDRNKRGRGDFKNSRQHDRDDRGHGRQADRNHGNDRNDRGRGRDRRGGRGNHMKNGDRNDNRRYDNPRNDGRPSSSHSQSSNTSYRSQQYPPPPNPAFQNFNNKFDQSTGRKFTPPPLPPPPPPQNNNASYRQSGPAPPSQPPTWPNFNHLPPPPPPPPHGAPPPVDYNNPAVQNAMRLVQNFFQSQQQSPQQGHQNRFAPPPALQQYPAQTYNPAYGQNYGNAQQQNTSHGQGGQQYGNGSNVGWGQQAGYGGQNQNQNQNQNQGQRDSQQGGANNSSGSYYGQQDGGYGYGRR